MVLPLLPFIPAGIAALGGAGRFFNSPTGQRAVQGGIQMFRNLPTTLQGYINPLSQAVGGPQFAAKPLTATGAAMTALETPGLMVDAARGMGVGSAEADDPDAADIEEMLEEEEDKKKKKKKKKKNKKEEKEEEPSLDMIPMKKGGYAKKKRKIKPYKPSSFVKMKGRKRYI